MVTVTQDHLRQLRAVMWNVDTMPEIYVSITDDLAYAYAVVFHDKSVGYVSAAGPALQYWSAHTHTGGHPPRGTRVHLTLDPRLAVSDGL